MSNSPQPPNDGDILPHNLHHIIQHNSNTSYPQEQHYDDGSHLHSHYGSPMPQQDDGYYQQQGYGYDQGMGSQYVRVHGHLSLNGQLMLDRMDMADKSTKTITALPRPHLQRHQWVREICYGQEVVWESREANKTCDQCQREDREPQNLQNQRKPKQQRRRQRRRLQSLTSH